MKINSPNESKKFENSAFLIFGFKLSHGSKGNEFARKVVILVAKTKVSKAQNCLARVCTMLPSMY